MLEWVEPTVVEFLSLDFPAPRTVRNVCSLSHPVYVWHFNNQAAAAAAKSLQSCLTLCDPMDYSPPGSFVPGILQAKIMEWVAMPSSKGSFRPRDRTYVSCLLHWQAGSSLLVPPGKPNSSSYKGTNPSKEAYTHDLL